MKLSELIKQESFASPAQKALLNVMVSSSWVMNELSSMMATYDITPAQYNVLRILRGSHPEPLTCSAVGERLLDRTPDVTRLLNRLEGRALVERQRASHDRRVVEVGITKQGRALLKRMAPEVEAVQQRLTCHLSTHEQRQLSDLLEKLREDQ
ncbi:MAG: MarR family transcriptional regulator [Bacteroidetes bacterium]|jgi:DNA-binding MarR family transcriptional regulator|nr:MarR family transcriptional regulator [Bacteroidota bacterium]